MPSPTFLGAMDAKAIRLLDLQCRTKFIYRADPEGQNTWRSHLAEVRAGRTWYGNCDDLCSTVLDSIATAGAALDAIYRIEVGADGAAAPNHLIGCIWDDGGVCWIVGDTFGEAYPAGECRHRPFSYQRMDEIDIVRDGAPWGVPGDPGEGGALRRS